VLWTFWTFLCKYVCKKFCFKSGLILHTCVRCLYGGGLLVMNVCPRDLVKVVKEIFWDIPAMSLKIA
jgi:hypothetical protein